MTTPAPGSAPQQADPPPTPPAAGGATPPASPPAPEPAKPDTPPAGDSPKPGGKPDDPKPPAAGQFTQADLDRIVSERLTRERDAWGKKLAGALGLPGGETDPEKVLEQTTARASGAERTAALALTEAIALRAGISAEKVERFVKLTDPEGALKDVDRADETAVRSALKTAVEGTAKDWPEFKGGTGYPPSSGGDRNGTPPPVDLAAFKKMEMGERAKLLADQPEVYAQLRDQEIEQARG